MGELSAYEGARRGPHRATCGVCGGEPGMPWIRVRWVPWGVYPGFCSDEQIEGWADLAETDGRTARNGELLYQHYRCPASIHGRESSPAPVEKRLETIEIMVRINAPIPEGIAAHSREATDAMHAAVDAATDAVKADPNVDYVGVGYGIPRRREWRT